MKSTCKHLFYNHTLTAAHLLNLTSPHKSFVELMSPINAEITVYKDCNRGQDWLTLTALQG